MSVKVSKIIGSGEEMKHTEGNRIYVASEIDGRYVITYHDGMMPPFRTEHFGNLTDLANGMRRIANLRRWAKRPAEDYA